jgi:ATP-binding cassette subfamily C exporter for protease/lipase
MLVLDEPNANLDEAGEAALINTIRQLKAKNKTVFLITHRPGAVAVADRVILLQDGQIVSDGPRETVLAGLRGPRPAAPRKEPPNSAIGSAQPA